MALSNWTANEVVTDSNYNEMVNDVPESQLYIATPFSTTFKGKASVTWQLLATLTLAPVLANYLCFRLQARASSGTAQFKFELEQSGVIENVYDETAISGSTWTDYEATIDLTTLATAGDVTGTDCVLKLYGNDKVEIRAVHIYGGSSSAVADYGGA